jgi:hypothetical protein
MQWSHWLQGGPFLEVSFLLELKEKKKETIQDIIFNLSKVRNRIEIYDKNVDEIIDFFDRGYPYDEEDPQTNYIHSLRLSLYVYLSRKRKATLQIEMVSSNAIMVNFCFFGSNFDALEWDQIGIKKEEITDFTNFLRSIFLLFLSVTYRYYLCSYLSYKILRSSMIFDSYWLSPKKFHTFIED